MKMRVMFAVLLSAASMVVQAAKSPDAPAANCEGLKIATGPAGKGYSKLFHDISRSCGTVVPVCEVNTNGGLDNLNALSTKDADVGFAQADTWEAMSKGDENIAGLRAVFGLNQNYLHTLVASAGFVIKGASKWGGLSKEDDQRVVIQRFSDLRGRKVALVGSAQLLVRQLNKQLGLNMAPVDVDKDSDAFDLVKQGVVAAAMSVSGWPSGPVKSLNANSGLTMVPFDLPSPNGQFSVKPLNYKSIGVYNSNALAMPNVLFTRPFRGEKAEQVAKLKGCLSAHLADLQDGDYEPAWNQVNNLDGTYGLPGVALGSAANAPKKK